MSGHTTSARRDADFQQAVDRLVDELTERLQSEEVVNIDDFARDQSQIQLALICNIPSSVWPLSFT